MPNDLDSDIQSAWGRAHSLRVSATATAAEVAALIDDLRGCATRAKALGLPGEQDLLRLVDRLQWLTTGERQPTYTLG